jgi:hypothetical protein
VISHQRQYSKRTPKSSFERTPSRIDDPDCQSSRVPNERVRLGSQLRRKVQQLAKLRLSPTDQHPTMPARCLTRMVQVSAAAFGWGSGTVRRYRGAGSISGAGTGFDPVAPRRTAQCWASTAPIRAARSASWRSSYSATLNTLPRAAPASSSMA